MATQKVYNHLTGNYLVEAEKIVEPEVLIYEPAQNEEINLEAMTKRKRKAFMLLYFLEEI